MATTTKTWGTGEGSVTVTYNGSGNGTITVTSSDNNLHEGRSMTFTVKTTDNKKSQTITVSQAAKPYIDLSAAVVTAANQTYSGSALTPVVTVTLNGSTVPSTGYDVQYSNNTNAGTATITITGKGDYTGTATGTFSIAKANPTNITAPTAKSSLTYNGSSKALVNAGSATGGTMYYLATTTNTKPGSTSGFSTSIPTGTNAGTYYIWYYVKGDSNHTNTAINSTAVSASIAKASRTLSFPNPITVISPSSTFTNIAVPSAGAGDGTISYSSGTTSKATVNSSTGAVTGVAEGTSVITATISAGTNYNSASATYTITVQAAVKNYAYTGSVQSNSFPAAIYKLQVWGAQGGSNAADSSYSITAKAGGKGGYSVGILKLANASTLYAFVGGRGGASGNGGWNGGGGGSGSSSYNSGNDVTKMGCGGGGTDIALTTSSMSYSSYRNNRTGASLKSRMIVAGGGGGGAMRCTKTSSSTTTPVDLTSGATTGKYLSTTGVATNGDYYNIKRIQLSSGQRLTATVWVGAETCYFATTNSSGSSYAPISTANSYGSYTIDYTASSACYVAVCFLSNTGTVDNDYTLSIYAQLSSRSDITTSTIQNVEWSKVFLDNEDKIISGIRTDNTLYTGLSYNKGTSSANIITSSTTNTTSYKVGYVGGGASGGGYSSTYQGRQTAAGTNGAFGKGANQTTTSYKYASACGGGGWYGGGGGRYNNSTSSYMQQSGGGSGFVNTAANASSRPSSYTGLQLDQGTTYAGSTSFESTSGSTETGHAGDGYARITRVSPLDAVADIVYAKLDAGNVDYSEVTDTEWQHVLVDNDNKILAGIRQDGTMFVSDYIQNL